MKKRSLLRKILYVLGSLVVLIAISVWIFLTFFFQGTLNKVLIPKLQEAVYSSTNGRFALSLDKISYSGGTLICQSFKLSRIAIDSSEHGIALQQLTIDTVRFEGLRWWSIVMGEDLALHTLEMNNPKLSLSDADSQRVSLPLVSHDTSKKSSVKASDIPVISFDSIMLRDVNIFLPNANKNGVEPSFRNISFTLREFLLDVNSTKVQPLFFSKRITFDLQKGTYVMSDSMYSIVIVGLRGNLSDSLVTIDSFLYKPNYSEQAFADIHPYIQGRLTFGCTGVKVSGVSFGKVMQGGGLHIKKCEAVTWNTDYYGDRRKPHNPHPPDATLPHIALGGISTPITIDSIILNNGMITHRERAPGSSKPSLITFTKARVSATPFCTDTLSPLCQQPLRIAVDALFMGQGRILGTVVYPIHQKAFDLKIDATVGPFDIPSVNSYLVTNERKEITGGKFLGGEIHMNVKSGKGVTTVSPRYTDLGIKLLSEDAKKKSGIIEGLKSFVANTFILRTENVTNWHRTQISGTTNYNYSKKEEFFEFIWLALRRSIGKVAGF